MSAIKDWSGCFLEKSAEKFAEWSLGQTVLNQADKLLWVFEKSTEWSVPVTKQAIEDADPNTSDETNEPPKLIRPLPWLLFLPVLLLLRLMRFFINSALNLLGYDSYPASKYVEIFQNARLRIRAWRYQAALSKSRKASHVKMLNHDSVPIMTRLRNAIGSSLCYSSHNILSSSDLNMEKITLAGKHFTDVINNSQTALKRFISNAENKKGAKDESDVKTIATQTTLQRKHNKKSKRKTSDEVYNSNYSTIESHTTESECMSDLTDYEINNPIRNTFKHSPKLTNSEDDSMTATTSDLESILNSDHATSYQKAGIPELDDVFLSPTDSLCSTPEPNKFKHINAFCDNHTGKSLVEPSKLPTASNKAFRLANNMRNLNYQRAYFSDNNNLRKNLDESTTTSIPITETIYSTTKSSSTAKKSTRKINKKTTSSNSNLTPHIPIPSSSTRASQNRKNCVNK